MGLKIQDAKIKSDNGHGINGKIPYEIWDDFVELYTIHKRTDRKITMWQFLMLIIRKGIQNWLK